MKYQPWGPSGVERSEALCFCLLVSQLAVDVNTVCQSSVISCQAEGRTRPALRLSIRVAIVSSDFPATCTAEGSCKWSDS